MMNPEHGQRVSWQNKRFSLPTVGVLLAVVGAAAFGAGQSLSSEPSPPLSHGSHAPPEPAAMPMDMGESTEQLPPGHPPIDPMSQAGAQMPAAVGGQEAPKSALAWDAPARWQLVANASPMRLATYRVPHAPGDSVDAELSITQAGGSVQANADRWIGQFDVASQKTAKRGQRVVGALEVTMVEVQGSYSGGMVKDAPAGAGWGLLGAIVSTPGMPHFFKLTGPAKSVAAARAEFDTMIGSVALR